MSCEHFLAINVEPSFLTPFSNKMLWTCLYDGCFKIKTNISRSHLVAACSKHSDDHKVMINCQTFEIFCTQCQQQIYDEEEEEDTALQRKPKRTKKINATFFRQFLVQNQQTQSIVFGGNPEYPPSFQKQKRGLCGLQMQSLNSYMTSLIQLFSYVPVFAEVCCLVDPTKLHSKFLQRWMTTIDMIWSGKYRIMKIDELQSLLITEQPNFRSYQNKTPQNLMSFLLRKLKEEFYFSQVACASGKMTGDSYDEWETKNTVNYTLLQDIFTGKGILEKSCGNCKNIMLNENAFEYLKVTYERSQFQDYKYTAELSLLIQKALNWRNNNELIVKKIEEGQFLCEKCLSKLNEYNCFVDMPNNLIIEFGEDIDGINVVLPNQIDLRHFSEGYIKKKEQDNPYGGYEYVGSIYRKNKKYIAHVRNLQTNKEFTMMDELVNAGQKCHENIKLAIYKRSAPPKYKPLSRNIASCLQVSINPIVPLPDFWSCYLKHNYRVPPLVNPFICSHAKIKNNINLSKVKKGPQRIPAEVYQYLLQIFGGRQIALSHNQHDLCAKCQQRTALIAEIKASEKEMAIFADNLSNKTVKVYIDRNWLQSWRKFIYQQKNEGYRIFGNARPNKIDNSASKIDSFKKVSPEVWYFLHKFYGGGPLRAFKGYNPNVVLKTAVNLRFENTKPLLKQLQMDRFEQQSQQNNNEQIVELEEQYVEEPASIQ